MISADVEGFGQERQVGFMLAGGVEKAAPMVVVGGGVVPSPAPTDRDFHQTWRYWRSLLEGHAVPHDPSAGRVPEAQPQVTIHIVFRTCERPLSDDPFAVAPVLEHAFIETRAEDRMHEVAVQILQAFHLEAHPQTVRLASFQADRMLDETEAFVTPVTGGRESPAVARVANRSELRPERRVGRDDRPALGKLADSLERETPVRNEIAFVPGGRSFDRESRGGGEPADQKQREALVSTVPKHGLVLIVGWDGPARVILLMASRREAGQVWAKSRLRDRIDSVIAPDDAKSLTGDHDLTELITPNTTLPIFPLPAIVQRPRSVESRISPMRGDAIVLFVATTAYFALFCWVPMFLIHAPACILWTEPAVLLAAGFASSRMANMGNNATESRYENWIAMGAVVVGVSLFQLFMPGWTGSQWIIPVLAHIPWWCIFGFGALIHLAVWAMGEGLNR